MNDDARKLEEYGIYKVYHANKLQQYLDSFPALVSRDIKLYIQKLEKMYQEGVGIFIYGDPGTGKTGVVAEIGKIAILKNHWVFRLVPFSVLLDAYSYRWSNTRQMEFWEACHRAHFLAIDDVLKETESRRDTATAALDQILKYRIQNKLPVIITSNFTGKSIEEAYGEYVFSLIRESTGLILEVRGSDYRAKITKEKMRLLRERSSI